MANAAFLRAPSVSPDDCRSAVTALQQTPPEGVTKREASRDAGSLFKNDL